MKLELKDVKLPNYWQEISIRQMRDMISSQIDKDITLREKILNYLSIVISLPKDILKKCDDKQLMSLYKKIEWFDNTKIKDIDMTNHILNIDGVEYGVSKLDEKSLDEFIDGESSIDASDRLLKIEEVISISTRPIIEKYEDGSYKLEPYDYIKCNARREMLIDTIDAEVGYNIYAFFLFKDSSLFNVINGFLTQRMEKMTNNLGSVKSGDGLM